MFDIIPHVELINVEYTCSECAKNVVMPFTATPQYNSIKHDDELVIDYIESHLSYDLIEDLSNGVPVTITMYSQLCSDKECKRSSLKKQKNDILDDIKVPPLHKSVPPVAALETEFDGHSGVLYLGKVGTGKTYKAVALMKRYIISKGGVNKCTYRFINACDLFFSAQEEMNVKPKDGISILRKCINVDILVLDDVGTEKFSEWTNSHLYFVINSRLENMKPTIITTNILDKGGIDAKFNERIASRLNLYNTIVVRGIDRRKISAK